MLKKRWLKMLIAAHFRHGKTKTICRWRSDLPCSQPSEYHKRFLASYSIGNDPFVNYA